MIEKRVLNISTSQSSAKWKTFHVDVSLWTGISPWPLDVTLGTCCSLNFRGEGENWPICWSDAPNNRAASCWLHSPSRAFSTAGINTALYACSSSEETCRSAESRSMTADVSASSRLMASKVGIARLDKKHTRSRWRGEIMFLYSWVRTGKFDNSSETRLLISEFLDKSGWGNGGRFFPEATASVTPVLKLHRKNEEKSKPLENYKSKKIYTSINQSTEQSTDQSINRSINQSTEQSIDRSINQSING